MSKTTAINTPATSERELTEAELALVSGGNPKGGSHSHPIKYLKITMKNEIVSSLA